MAVASRPTPPIDPARALSIESADLCAFFDAELSLVASPLMSGPASQYSEVMFSKYPTPSR